VSYLPIAQAELRFVKQFILVPILPAVFQEKIHLISYSGRAFTTSVLFLK